MRRIVTTLLAMTLFGSVAPASAVPPIATGALSSSNVDFVANIPDAPAIGAHIIGETMYVTTGQGLRIYDVSLGIPVLQGALELPHFENENVDTNGKILLISADSAFSFPKNFFFVIDVSNVHAPLLLSAMTTSSGHTATCIQDCAYAWISGSGPGIAVIDLADPAKPVEIGYFGPDSHDVDVDAAGIAWASGSFGSGGLYAYDVVNYGPGPDNTAPGKLLNPREIARRNPGTPQSFHNAFIIHNSMRPNAELPTPEQLADTTIDPGETVLVTEENWQATENNLCSDDGQFQTGWFHTVGGVPTIEKLDTFHIGQGTVTAPETPGKPIGVAACSSHWFDESGGVIADAWYEQGVRFFTVDQPTGKIRHIGYYLPVVTEAWMAKFHTVSSGPTAGTYVYVLDAARGIDILKFTGSPNDPVALAPRFNTAQPLSGPGLRWGYACRRLGSARAIPSRTA